MALRQLSLLYRNSLVILVSYHSVVAIGVDIVIVIVLQDPLRMGTNVFFDDLFH